MKIRGEIKGVGTVTLALFLMAHSVASGSDTGPSTSVYENPLPARSMDFIEAAAANAGKGVEEYLQGLGPSEISHSIAPLGVDEAELVDLALIAESEGISLQQAVTRYGSQSEYSLFNQEMQELYPETYAGAEFFGSDEDFWIGFKNSVPSSVHARISELPGKVAVTEDLQFSNRELAEAAHGSEVRRILEAPGEQIVEIDPRNQKLQVLTPSPSGAASWPARSAGVPIEVRHVTQLPPGTEDVGIRGGGILGGWGLYSRPDYEEN
ncbi:hypothetical protein [Ornithinimicrobium faecis]|uniref:hypothetical protein n=1 Tax=Ornithinimicrobium faecis TaxID=2934158 RepID=UPI002118D3A5|nr:hypothetical protein [Ornithinimicrobium sp. HY1745]